MKNAGYANTSERAAGSVVPTDIPEVQQRHAAMSFAGAGQALTAQGPLAEVPAVPTATPRHQHANTLKIVVLESTWYSTAFHDSIND